MEPQEASGFTLLESLLAVSLMVVLLAILAASVTTQVRVGESQVSRLEREQSLEIAAEELHRAVGVAGLGGLPADKAVEVLPSAVVTRIGSAAVQEDTDVLVVRGVLSTHLLEMPVRSPMILDDEDGEVVLDLFGTTPAGEHQDLSPLLDQRLSSGAFLPVPLLVAGSDGVGRVLVIRGGTTTEITDGGQTELRLQLMVGLPDGSSPDERGLLDLVEATALDGSWRPATVGVLEERRFFVRAGGSRGPATAGALTQAEMLPGAQIAKPFGSGASWDLLGNVEEFSVSVATSLPARDAPWTFGAADGSRIRLLRIEMQSGGRSLQRVLEVGTL